MMKGKKKRLLAGTLALLLSCSTLLNTGITALASEQSEEHAQIQEVKQEEAASETLPELEEVKEQLTEEELVYAEDLTIKAGESFDLETDYRGFQKNDEKVKVTFLKAEGDSGNSFDFINVNIKMYIFDHLRMYIFAILPLDRYIFLSDKIFL